MKEEYIQRSSYACGEGSGAVVYTVVVQPLSPASSPRAHSGQKTLSLCVLDLQTLSHALSISNSRGLPLCFDSPKELSLQANRSAPRAPLGGTLSLSSTNQQHIPSTVRGGTHSRYRECNPKQQCSRHYQVTTELRW